MSNDECTCSSSQIYSVYGVLGSLLVISEILGMVSHIKANSIIHFVFLTMKHLLMKPKINPASIIDALEEALIDEKNEEEAETKINIS